MTTLKDTLENLGDLHDARVMSIRWDSHLADLDFTFEDIYANFAGLANHPGKEQGSIVLHNVKELDVAIETIGLAHIYAFSVIEIEGDFLATVLFRPSGKITARFTSADFPEVRLLE